MFITFAYLSLIIILHLIPYPNLLHYNPTLHRPFQPIRTPYLRNPRTAGWSLSNYWLRFALRSVSRSPQVFWKGNCIVTSTAVVMCDFNVDLQNWAKSYTFVPALQKQLSFPHLPLTIPVPVNHCPHTSPTIWTVSFHRADSFFPQTLPPHLIHHSPIHSPPNLSKSTSLYLSPLAKSNEPTF